jgi:pteridine reductase
VTGASRRIGAAIAACLHDDGYSLGLHYRSGADEAHRLRNQFNDARPDSAITIAADLREIERLPKLVDACCEAFGGLDVVVNNASVFYPTPLGEVAVKHWQEIMDCNLAAPLFLTQAAAPRLRERRGCVINIVDIYAERPLPQHPVYCASKAGLAMLTRALARELAPSVRVNGVSPGAILWPAAAADDTDHAGVLARIPLGRRGEPEDIASAVRYLVGDAPYVTGQILAVDGGRTVSI